MEGSLIEDVGLNVRFTAMGVLGSVGAGVVVVIAGVLACAVVVGAALRGVLVGSI